MTTMGSLQTEWSCQYRHQLRLPNRKYIDKLMINIKRLEKEKTNPIKKETKKTSYQEI